MQRQTDRVNFSFSMKVPGPVQFSSLTFSSSFSTDLQPEETPEDAMERARKFVMSEVEKDYNANSASKADDDDYAAEAKVHKKGKRSKGSLRSGEADKEEDED